MAAIDNLFYAWAIGGFLFLVAFLIFSKPEDMHDANYVKTLAAFFFWPVSVIAVVVYLIIERKDKSSYR